ncbi:MAG: hypothetical protein ACOY4O_16760 [Pseudomonadota bacterium]
MISRSARAASKKLGVAFWILATTATSATSATTWENARRLSDREKTFLKTLFTGDEAKTVEYAQIAGINVNSIAGEPLSVWFYRLGTMDNGPSQYRNPNVQRIVFERFKQNPNPQGIGEANLEYFCTAPQAPRDFGIETRGTPEQLKELRERQAQFRRPYIDAMAQGFSSLIRYGLRDRAAITQMFRGCILRSAMPLDSFYYDTVLSPMVKAGADVNARDQGGMRLIEHAVQNLNADTVERLIRDGAQINMSLRSGNCAQPSNLYGYLFTHIRGNSQYLLIRTVRALSAGGLPPTIPVAYTTMNGYGSCKFSSFLDAVIDTGNVDLARQFKEAASLTRSSLPPSSPQQAAATQSTSPATTPPQTVAVPAATISPGQIGAWRIAIKSDGRPQASTKSNYDGADRLSGLILECVAGGRLEYVPAVLKLNGAAKSLHVHGKDDNMNGFNLTNGRLSGAFAATLSRELLQAEVNAHRQGVGDKWDIGMTVDDPFVEESMVQMSGFAKMRSLMIANCKS